MARSCVSCPPARYDRNLLKARKFGASPQQVHRRNIAKAWRPRDCKEMARGLPMTEATHVETDVLVIGSGAAGMYAAIEAAQAGAAVLLADRSLIGRGGATVMAQMTVAVALDSQTPDHWTHHLRDTLEAGRGLCDESLSRLLCEEGPDCIRQMDDWGIGWARQDGRRDRPIVAAQAPGHDRPRCVYVDF